MRVLRAETGRLKPAPTAETIVGLALTVLIAGALAVSPSAQQNGDGAKLKNPVEANAASIEAGQKVYQRYCRACHGPKGEGGPQAEIGPAPSNFTDAKWEHGASDGEIFTVIKSGIPPDFNMEAWGDRISDAEIWNVVNYVRTLAKK